MMASKAFSIDGQQFNVLVTSLKRSFSVLDSDSSGRTADGDMYRDIIGTFYNYEMTVAPMSGHESDFDALWEVLSQPVDSHVCSFPYGQSTITQTMYITSGEQEIKRIGSRNYWDEIDLKFVAKSPYIRA